MLYDMIWSITFMHRHTGSHSEHPMARNVPLCPGQLAHFVATESWSEDGHGAGRNVTMRYRGNFRIHSKYRYIYHKPQQMGISWEIIGWYNLANSGSDWLEVLNIYVWPILQAYWLGLWKKWTWYSSSILGSLRWTRVEGC